MALSKIIICKLFCFVLIDSHIIGNDYVQNSKNYISEQLNNTSDYKVNLDIGIGKDNEEDVASAFNGVYAECFVYLSFSCVQRKTLLYLLKLNDLNEISVLGDYLKFVKTNSSQENQDFSINDTSKNYNSTELSLLIDGIVNRFFENHVLRFKALGRDISLSKTVDEFVGRKKRKGGGGGGGHDDGKKKMMMMAMMCMKMKFMVMVPAMMGMMGMMSFKGMMFSMMSFMASKMMLLLKILEKKGGGGGGGGGGGDGGWAASGGGGGAWMPAGGPDYGGGGGGGYDSNGQWQSRSLSENFQPGDEETKPIVTYVTPVASYNNYKDYKNTLKSVIKNLSDEVIKINNKKDDDDRINLTERNKSKSRSKRGIMDFIQNAYFYWINQLLGKIPSNKNTLYPKYKIINGIKYVYSPIRTVVKPKAPKAIQPENSNAIKTTEENGFKPIISVEDFNKGEIVDVAERRMNKKKWHQMQQKVSEMNDAIEDNPWQ